MVASAFPHPQESSALVCINHSVIETLLRCNRCNRPVCLKCVLQTEVGYRCKACIRTQQNSYCNAVSGDHTLVFVLSLLLGALSGLNTGLLFNVEPLWGAVLALIVGPAAAQLLMQMVHKTANQRRGLYFCYAALTGFSIGTLGGTLITAFILGFTPSISLPVWAFTLTTSYITFQLFK